MAAYKQLNEVERGFSNLKDLLEFRPVYHHQDTRVQAHVFIAALAPLLNPCAGKSLRAAGSQLSMPFPWKALEWSAAWKSSSASADKLCVTRGNQHIAEILRVLGIEHRTRLPPRRDENASCNDQTHKSRPYFQGLTAANIKHALADWNCIVSRS